jgi:hypothetical protein
VAALATALFVVGCGGGGGGASASDDIKADITRFIKGHDCSAATAAYRKQLTGSADAKSCSHDLSLRNKVKSISIDGVTSSGDKGSADVVTDGDHITLTMVKQDGTWLVAGDKVGKTSNSAPTSPPAPTTTAAPTASPDQARADLAAAKVPYTAGRKRFEKNTVADLKAQNLDAVKGDFSRYRDIVFNFDGAVRKIDVPASARDALSTLLQADRSEIADLDAVGSAPSFAELQRLLTDRLKTDDDALTRAVSAFSSAL